MPMRDGAAAAAAALFIEARRTGVRISALPADLKPASVADALAVQAATAAGLGEEVAGYKVASVVEGQLLSGMILRSVVGHSPARIPAASMPLLGVEAEIAFRFDQPLPPRERAFTAEEVAAAVTALVAIEVVDTRFASYAETPFLDRAADCVSNGGLVLGTARADWQAFDLERIEAALTIGSKDVVRRSGGHPAGHPLKPAVALVNSLRTGPGVARGLIMTTGTYTGLNFAKAADRVVASFTAFGTAELEFSP